MPAEDVVARVGPVLQHYLTGDLPERVRLAMRGRLRPFAVSLALVHRSHRALTAHRGAQFNT